MIGTGKSVEQVRSRTNQALAKILRRIDVLGLTVAPEKTEAVLFFGKKRPDLDPVIRLGRTYIKMSPRIRYVPWDYRLNFSAHFKYVEEKMGKVNRALGRLMPNLRGPTEWKRRLYSNILSSVALYGAPIWSDALQRSEVNKRLLRKSQKTMAQRVCSAYRTVSFDAATLLASTQLLDLLAIERRITYQRIREAESRGELSLDERNQIRNEEKKATAGRWTERLNHPRTAGRRTMEGVLPHINEWMARR